MAEENGNTSSHEMLKSIWKKVDDIDKDVDVLRYGNKGGNMDSALPYLVGMNAGNRGYGYGGDAALWAMNNNWMNNPFMYLILLAMFGGNGYFGNGWGNNGYGNGAAVAAMGAANSAETTNLLMNAINNSSATSQRDFDRLANAFGTTAATVQNGLNAINTSITQVAGQMGMNTQQVINAIQSGDCGIMNAVQRACCENRLAICEQTNTLQQGQFQLGVTMERQGDMTRALIREQSFEAQIRNLTQQNEQLRDAAQTASLQNTINSGDAAIMAQLTAISTQLQNQINAQAYELKTIEGKIGTGA